MTARFLPPAAAVLLAGSMLAACAQNPSALDPAGPEAGAVNSVFWIFTAVCAVVWVLVVITVIAVLIRRHRGRPEPLAANLRQESRFRAIVSILTGITALTVIALSFVSFGAQARLFGNDQPDALSIKIIGHQWWWEVQYEDPQPSRSFTTANELHVPIGRQVAITLTSSDVIHSFWVPNLMGKLDLIPGRENELRFTVDKAGAYRGQCAEFCGLQHAHMGLAVFADTPENFQSWFDGQVASAAPPAEPHRQKGEAVFLANPCVTCHAIRGTPAGARFGPDLTHLASRSSIAAQTLPMSRGALAAWINDPQSIKPGANMPTVPLDPEELNALVDYLEGLK